MWPRVCSVQPSLIQSSKSVSHTVIHPSPPWLLWSPAAFLVMEILHPLSSSLPSPTSFSLCRHSTFTFFLLSNPSVAHLHLALSAKLIDSEPSLGALCASSFLQKLIRATVSYSRLPPYWRATKTNSVCYGVCFFVRQSDKVSVSDSQYFLTVTEVTNMWYFDAPHRCWLGSGFWKCHIREPYKRVYINRLVSCIRIFIHWDNDRTQSPSAASVGFWWLSSTNESQTIWVFISIFSPHTINSLPFCPLCSL